MPTTWRKAPDVAEIAAEMIDLYLTGLSEATIHYLFRDKAKKSKGMTVWGCAMKKGGFDAYMRKKVFSEEEFEEGDDYFVIEIAFDRWKDLTDVQKQALVLHELCHCYIDEGGNYHLLPHDIEEFGRVVQIFGCEWRENLKQFGKTVIEASGQRTLDLADPDTIVIPVEQAELILLEEVRGDMETVKRIVNRFTLHKNRERTLQDALDDTREILAGNQEAAPTVKKSVRKLLKTLEESGATMTLVTGGKSATVGKKLAEAEVAA